MVVFNPYDDDDDVATTVRAWRRESSTPFIENEPTDRPEQPCWCTDFHREVGLALTYCPRHGRAPDPELWDAATAPPPPHHQGETER
jgi:hypothetical protein